MRRSFAAFGLLALGLAGFATFSTLTSESTQAASSEATFIVPADDGYGVADCASSTCGKVVADQWCAAQGYGAALAFGVAEPVETTGSVAVVRRATAETRPFSITCSR